MFANCSMGGMNNAMPDVCLTPVPSPTGPIPTPIPYPNIALLPMAVPPTANMTHFINFMPTHTISTMIPTSNGDEPGVLGGVMSGIFIGPSRHIKGSVKVFSKGLPVTRSTMDPTMQNLTNAIGTTIVPSQFKVIIAT